ncbi:MAG: DUF115 domain-containing protein [Methanimicrococcus sp.]|nr:DUF115 domain-containing protein [Methanimicrococcus sp.]
MIFEEWASTYHQILKDFNFSERKDADSAAYLSKIYQESVSQNERENAFVNLKSQILGKSVIVCGNAPTLEKELSFYVNDETNKKKHNSLKNIWIAADGAAVILLKQKIVPDIIVTDLDGTNPNDAETEIKAIDNGSFLVIHAHGDNQDKLEKYVAKLEKKQLSRIIPTCQCRPPANIYNFGGFTDGDRSVFLAEELGAAQIILLGFDFKDHNITDLKKKKLKWAEKLIYRRIQKNPHKIKYFNEIHKDDEGNQ